MTRPQGGYFVWVELPADVDALSIHGQALKHGIGVAPGQLFSADQRYCHHLRINLGYPGDPRTEASYKVLGDIAHRVREGSTQ